MKTIYKKLLFLLLMLPVGAFSQSLEGTVVDNTSKQPLPGVNILVQGTSAGTQTDFDGKFKINGKKGDKIVFSYLGYTNVVVDFNAQANLVISLKEESNQMQEVVVQVGYGSVKKKDATGAVELITAKDFNKGAITSVDGLLNGRASGVVVTSSGTPGDGAVIRIRGGSSLYASNDPLIVIDGLPIDGGLSSVNPNDIESFSILKDASSAAIYGNRASGGVILITTKKGSKKGLQVSLNTFTTLNTLARKVEVYNADEFRTLISTRVPDKANQLGTANTDWQREIFHDSYTSDLNLSVLGNIFNKVPARITLGNTDNNGILLTSQYTRSTVSFALNPSFFTDHLKINATGNYAYTFRRSADEGAIGSAVSMDPTHPIYDPASNYAGYYENVTPGVFGAGTSGTPAGTANPVALLLERRNVNNSKRFYGNFNIDYKFHFFPALRAIVNLGIDKEEGEGTNTTNPFSRSGFNSGITVPAGDVNNNGRRIGNYSKTWYDNRNENLSAQLNYNKAFGKLNVDFLAGYDYQKFEYQNFTSGNINLYDRVATEINNRDIYTDPGNVLIAYLGRLNLGFDDKYLVTVNFRRDGSSRISPRNVWGNFYGAAFAWKIKEEKFLKNSKIFSDLKLRLSYGETGQQKIPDAFAWFKKYNISNNAYYQFGDQFYLVARPDGYNENLNWERSTKYNVGLDFGFFSNRLRGNIDGYFAKTTDMFAQTQQGALQNLGIYGPSNIGSLESKGVDLGLNVDAVKSKNFDLSFNYNVTYNHLELTELATDNTPTGDLGLQVNSQIHKVGLAPNSFWVYEQMYDANGRPIEGAYVDRDENGVIDSNDKYNYHKPQADVTMGFLTNATIYKNLDFSMAWRASFGNYVYDHVSSGRSTLISIDNTQNGTISNAPVDFNNTGFENSVKESDYYVKNATFLKLDNVTIGYNFRDLFNNPNPKTTLRVYVGAQNVLTITKYKGLDPEVFNNGIDGTIYPRSRMFMLGVNANF